MYGKKWFAISLVIASLLTTTACATKYETHGSIIKQDQIDRIKIGLHNRNDIAMILGTPSALSTFNSKRWYYLTEKTETAPLSTRKLIERDIVIVDFNDKGLVSSIAFKTKEDGNNITPAKKITETHGQTMGLVDQLIDNVSRGL